MPGRVEQLKARWARVQDEHSSVLIAVKSWKRLGDTNGNLYAGAITYFSFLALFPLLLLGVAVLGFVLYAHPDTLQTLFSKITNKVPGSVGQTLTDSIKKAIDLRASVGLVGLFGFLFTGLGWIGDLRRAVDAIWGRPPAKRKFLKEKSQDAVILGGLGLGLAVSLALTAVWTAASHAILSLLNLDDIPGMGTLLAVAGVLVTIVGDSVIFYWTLVRLPASEVSRPAARRAALVGAAGFEVLKIVGTVTIANTASSPTAGPFAGVVAILIWIQLVVRFYLFVVAITATLTDRELDDEAAALAAAVVLDSAQPRSSDAEPASLSPAAVGATLVGAGAVAGAAAAVYATRRSRSD